MTQIFIIWAMSIKKKNSGCNLINSVNPLYLRIINISGQFEKGKDDAWYLVISNKDNVYMKLVDILESIKNEITDKHGMLQNIIMTT